MSYEDIAFHLAILHTKEKNPNTITNYDADNMSGLDTTLQQVVEHNQ